MLYSNFRLNLGITFVAQGKKGRKHNAFTSDLSSIVHVLVFWSSFERIIEHFQTEGYFLPYWNFWTGSQNQVM